MSNVALTLAKDAVFQNVVVKNQTTFESGTFNTLQTRLLDAETATIDTLTVDMLNQSNSILNPFAGVTLTPNELVALTSTTTLTTFPYSQDAINETVIQRTATNSVQANLLAGTGVGNQLVLGIIAFNSAQNGFTGSIGFGSSSSSQLVLSGGSSIVNSQAGINQLFVDESAGGASMSIRLFLETQTGQESSIVYSKADVEKWRWAFVDLPGITGRLELRNDVGNALVVVNIGDPQLPIEVQGNIVPGIANEYQLGVAAQRWGALHLTTQTLTGVGATANFTTNPSSGTATTVALATGPQSAASITFTNAALLATSPMFVNMNAYGGTLGIPMFQFNRASGSVIVINAHSLFQSLNGTATFAFGMLNSNGTGP